MTEEKTMIIEALVEEADSAIALKTGTLPVLSTAKVIAKFEEASWQLLAKDLEDGQSSVGSFMEIEHLRPSAIGSKIRYESHFLEQEGKRYRFNLEAYDGERLIAKGKHERVLIEEEAFMARLEKS